LPLLHDQYRASFAVKGLAVLSCDDLEAPGNLADTITERSDLKKLDLAGPAALGAMEMFNPGGGCHAAIVASRRRGG
jgi:hypothetical protein